MKIFIPIVLILFFAFSVFAQKQAEVIVTSTYLRKSPDFSAEKVQMVQKGEKITFEKDQDKDGWYYVSMLEGKVKGWIRKDTIRSVQKAEIDNQKPERIVSTPTPIESHTQIAEPLTPDNKMVNKRSPKNKEVNCQRSGFCQRPGRTLYFRFEEGRLHSLRGRSRTENHLFRNIRRTA